MPIVYTHIRKDKNEIFYVGIGNNIKRAYLRARRNRIWKDIVSKTEYEVKIEHKDIDWDLACQIEKYLIAYYGRKNKMLGTLANMTDGGEGIIGLIKTAEHRQKLSEANIGKKQSAETIEKKRISSTGRIKSIETRKKLSESKKGKPNIKQQGKFHSKARIVFDAETGNIYESVKDAAIDKNMKYTTLFNMIKGHKINKTSMYFLDQYSI